MSDSLAEANVEITHRGAVLERNKRMLAKLQEKYDSVLDQMEEGPDMTLKGLQKSMVRKMKEAIDKLKAESASVEEMMQLKEGIAKLKAKIEELERTGFTNVSPHEVSEDEQLRSRLNSAIVVEKPNIKWDDVTGLAYAKAILKAAIIMPTRFSQLFTGERQPFKGILLYGPPGTGEAPINLDPCKYSSSSNLTQYSI